MTNSFNSIFHFIHKNFLLALISTYILAVVLPSPGEAIRLITLGNISWFDGSTIKLSLPLLMLSFLLFNAGLAVKSNELVHLIKKPLILFLGLIANLSIPLAFTYIVALLMNFWHDPIEVQNILVGLALIASMPIAGSSTAWSQGANGNLALSLGLVLFSTMLSPILTPIVLNLIGFLAKGEYATELHNLASHGASGFLVISVVIPSCLGILTHFIFGEEKIEKIKPFLKLINLINLLVLSYSNAAISLPQAFAKPDWDFLFIIGLITISLCALAFFVGWLIPHILKSDTADQSSLMFGLGMNNNGTGLVLASMALSNHPSIMIPIIFYNLVQQVIAGIVDFKLLKENS